MNEAEKREAVVAKARELRWELGRNLHDRIMESMYAEAAGIADRAVTVEGGADHRSWVARVDRIVTSRIWGFPIMILLFALVFWITITGANVPSGLLASLLLDKAHPLLQGLADRIGLPWWLSGVLVDGMYLGTAWVVAVMLPPMAIFFPLFTLLEDLGYLPRVAFNLDHGFRRVGAHGKQALTMMMGFGCNAAGVISSRVIDSPRERLIAIITNNFALCNGRWPTQILLATVFIGTLVPAYLSGLISAVAVVTVAILGVLLSFGVSWLLSKTLLRGEVSSFSLELPPYRPPRILQTIYTSIIDRTIFVLWRAVVFAVPAGAAIWLVSNITIGGASLAERVIRSLDPFGILFGMNGVIILAYIVAIPANEIVIPTILMLTTLTTGISGFGAGTGVIFELDSLSETMGVLEVGGWTMLTGVCVMLFSLIHNPCSTTLYTIYKETGSAKWTIVSALLPLLLGFVVTFLVAQAWRFVQSL
jgi:ferrous iron transport protein B